MPGALRVSLRLRARPGRDPELPECETQRVKGARMQRFTITTGGIADRSLVWAGHWHADQVRRSHRHVD
eukprot:2814748-Rhodomonas_salina.3